MRMFPHLFLLAHQLKTTLGLKLIDNGLGLPVFGAEEAIVDFALLAGDKKATLPSQVQDLLIDWNHECWIFASTQFTICSSTSSNALLTALPFFQLLRQSGKPWVTLYMDPRPGREQHLFRYSVKGHSQFKLVRCRPMTNPMTDPKTDQRCKCQIFQQRKHKILLLSDFP